MENVIYEVLERKNMGLIAPLWEKLRRHHENRSKNFKKRYRHFRFEDRMAVLMEKVRGDLVHILAAREFPGGKIVGYCISSVDYLGGGEIDSLYVEERFRKDGVGSGLMERSLAWLEPQKVPPEKVKIVVAAGNEEAYPFYGKFGFIESKHVLERKGKKP